MRTQCITYNTDEERAILEQKETVDKVLGCGTEEISSTVQNEDGVPKQRKNRSVGRKFKPSGSTRATTSIEGLREEAEIQIKSGFYLDIPEWIACEPQTYEKIARIAALQLAGIPNTAIADEVGFSNQRFYVVLDKYKNEFAHVQKQLIQHAAVQLGVNLFAFRAALLDIMPNCIKQLGRLVESEDVKDSVRLEAIKTVMRASGINMAQATPLEEQVRKELQSFIREAAEDLGLYKQQAIDVTPVKE